MFVTLHPKIKNMLSLTDFNISIFSILPLCISAICATFLLISYRSRIARVSKHCRDCKPTIIENAINNTSSDEDFDDDFNNDGSSAFSLDFEVETPTTSVLLPPLPTASVIVYSNDEATNLASLLPQILKQDYPNEFEVIVVNDGSVESTSDVVSELQLNYSNLYLTYTPDRSRNLSRKKLALTLGIKAARYEVVVCVNANSRINSTHWLSLMTRNFNEKTDVVIGYATPDVEADQERGRRRRAFDRVAEAVKYLSAAISDTPFRGFSYNLAYRRHCFFDNKGFSRSLNLHYGDDDVFINEITNSHNTAVELSEESMVECRFYHPVASHNELKRRYNYTAKYLRKNASIFFGACSSVTWLWLLSSLAAILVSIPNLFSIIFSTVVALIIALVLWIPLIITWRNTMIALKSRKLMLTIPWFVLTRPFYNAIYKIKNKIDYRRNHTWIKK